MTFARIISISVGSVLALLGAAVLLDRLLEGEKHER